MWKNQMILKTLPPPNQAKANGVRELLSQGYTGVPLKAHKGPNVTLRPYFVGKSIFHNNTYSEFLLLSVV